MEKTIWIESFSGPNRKSKIQNRKLVGIVALVLAFVKCGAVAQAQQPKNNQGIYFATREFSTFTGGR